MDSESRTLSRPPLEQLWLVTTISQAHLSPAAEKYEELSRALVAAWPSEQDIRIIHALPVGLSAHLFSGICTPYSGSMHQDPPSPQQMLHLPQQGSHPVLIARKLLILGTFLQGVLPSSMTDLGGLSIPCHDIMSRVVETAVRLVTTNEDLIGSVEGIQCIMLEAMYQIYAGNLHRGWMAARRAITVAELMGLHRGLDSPSLKILEPETRAILDPVHLTFRLVEMDHFLSLMLGLPHTSLEAHFANPAILEGCQRIDRMQRIHCAAAGRILQRKDRNSEYTSEIDNLLQKAAAEMPPQWWLRPDLASSHSHGAEVLHDTVRLMDQFTHYHLLIRLHLPYMLRFSPDNRHDHYKITAINASRETLARYVDFRISNRAHFYCRGLDFLAFIASTVLCLAYIDYYKQRNSIFNFLVHSRPSDRGIMERTLSIIESMIGPDKDPIASKIACFLNNLLAIEAKASTGSIYSYSINSTIVNGRDGLGYDSELTNGGKVLHVYIPYFGTINLERDSSLAVPALSERAGTPTALDVGTFSSSQSGEAPEQPLSGSTFHSPSNEIDNLYSHPAPQIISHQLTERSSSPQQQQLAHADEGPSPFNNCNYNNIAGPQSSELVEPAGKDIDWGLQGVDVALFESLFPETQSPDIFSDEF